MIDPRAIVDPSAELDESVRVGPFSIIGPDVQIAADTVIESHVVVKGPTVIGKGNRIFQFASVGEENQDKKYKGEPTRLEIGDYNVIREGATLHRGTIQDHSLTRIGSHNLLMAYSHVAHDVMMGDHCILANSVAVAGHVHIGNHVILGGLTGVHQFCRIGDHAMAGAGSIILKDIPAYVMVTGNPAEARGMNFEGLKRRGFSKESIQALRKAYRVVFRQDLRVDDALAELAELEASFDEVRVFADSIRASTRGLVR